MSTSTPKKSENEEIDLGVLFNAIGNGISKLFSGITSVILFVFKTIINFVVFVRQRIVYFAIACSVGLVLGAIYESITPKTYVAITILEPHYDSARQLYNNVRYLDDLASQKDSVQIASFFGMAPSEAASITKLEIDPIIAEAKLLKEYNDYVAELDSLVAAEITFKDYVSDLNEFDRKIHVLKVKSTKQDIFGSLLDPIISSVSKTDYYKDQQITQLENLQLRDSITSVSITQTDSLLSVFKEVRLVEANKEYSNGSNTNLYMSQKAVDNTEVLLLDRKIMLTDELEQIRTDKLKATRVVDIISEFPNKGYLESSIWKNKKVQGILGGFLALSLFYLVLYSDKFIMSKTLE